MTYREIGKTGKMVSSLGFGCMRLPTIGGDNSKIDEEKAFEMINYAFENGINYYDTAYPYHSDGSGAQGQSEFFTGSALKDKRDNVYIASKLPTWLIHSKDDPEKYLDKQLKALDTDYIDFYLLHALNLETYNSIKKLDIIKFLEKAKSDGRIKHIGFSFHDGFSAFEQIINDYNWAFCQIQYNILDKAYQAGEKGLNLAKEKGTGIIVMEPLRGGLINDVVKPAKDILEKLNKDKSIVDWALSWLFNNKDISTVLSGMSTLDQVKENIKIADKNEADSMSGVELEAVDRVSKIISDSIKVPCTACKYCMPCPFGVDIPSCFSNYNSYYYFKEGSKAREKLIDQYNIYLDESEKAKNCTQCKACESHCPQNITISEEMQKVSALFEK